MAPGCRRVKDTLPVGGLVLIQTVVAIISGTLLSCGFVFTGLRIISPYAFVQNICQVHAAQIEDDGGFVVHFAGLNFRDDPTFPKFMIRCMGRTRRYRYIRNLKGYEIQTTQSVRRK